MLIRRTREEFIYFRIDGIEYSIKSYGVKATIVDYTLSRIRQGIVFDLSAYLTYEGVDRIKGTIVWQKVLSLRTLLWEQLGEPSLRLMLEIFDLVLS